MKMRLILSLLAAVLVVFSFLFVAALPLSPMPVQLVNSQHVQVRPVVMPSPPVAVSAALKQAVPEVVSVPDVKPDTKLDVKNEVFKCKENGQITYSTTPCAAGAVVADYNAKRASFTEGSDSISIARNSNGHYIVRGVADGQALDFMIDTGATGVSLPREFATGRHIVCEGVGVTRTAGGDVSMCFVTLKHLNVAGMDFYNVRANIIPTLKGEGLFGQTLLNQLKVTQIGGYLTLSR